MVSGYSLIIVSACLLAHSIVAELSIGALINTSVAMDRFLYFFFPFSSNGVTIRIDALVGGIRCYASDTNQRPSSTSYVWTLVITDYDDAFLDPSTLGGTPGSTVYVALQGVNAVNNFTLNTTIGDTSIQGNVRIRCSNCLDCNQC